MAASTVTFAGTPPSATDTSATNNITGVAWSTGDTVLVLAMTDDQGHTFSTPTNANLTFNSLSGLPTTTANSCKGYAWSATAANSQSAQTITCTLSNSGGAVAVCYVITAATTTGLGTPAVATDTAKTNSLTRVSNNSAVAWITGDWSASTDVTVDPSPAGGTQRVAGVSSGNATFFAYDWPDEGAAGTTSYGVANASGTGLLTKIALEIKGTASAAAASVDLVMAPMSSGATR